jgi:glycosidase
LEVVERTGLDAALGIEDIPGKLERMVTGEADPIDYFSLFRNWQLDEPQGRKHRWYRDQVVTLVDDHDQVRKWTAKRRFCGDSRYRDLAFNVMAAQLTTAGIPCIYYGSEQGFDSGGRTSDCDCRPPREHVRRTVRRPVHAGPALLRRAGRPVPRPGVAHRAAQASC